MFGKFKKRRELAKKRKLAEDLLAPPAEPAARQPSPPAPNAIKTPAPPSPDTGPEIGDGMPKARAEWLKKSSRELDPNASPEALCELRDGMTKDELRSHLALLYRRHNRAASSLDTRLRNEAEIMLNAVVECRKRYLT